MEKELEEFDINKTVAEFINLNIKEFVNSGLNIYKDTIDNLQLKFKSAYTNYLLNIADRYGKSKSFFIRDEPQELHTFYIPVGIESSNIKLNTANLKAILSHNSKTIISGTAGSGKSILLKYLLLNSLKDKKQVPIFIELRDSNISNKSLIDGIYDSLDCFGLHLEHKFIAKAFSLGHFILFLDGLDEVTHIKRIELIKEIDHLTKEFPKTSVIITTRPDNLTSELQIFSVFRTLPLSKDQSIALVEKLHADEQIKLKFMHDLQGELFKRHSSFLSNPLLLTIMLLTYGYSTDIPNKLSVFYNQAFEALFQRHDTMKGAYKRIKETKLDIQDFGKILSIFCIQTYDDRKIQFSRDEAITYLNKSKEIVNIEFNSEALLNDLLQSVCILIEDGLFITFSHRSFQEYFTAKFIVGSDTAMKKRLLIKYQKDILDDNIYKLCYELDCDFIEYEIIYPFLQDLSQQIKVKKDIYISHYLRFIKMMWTDFQFEKGSFWALVNSTCETNHIVRFVINNVAVDKIPRKFNFLDKSNWLKEQEENSKKDDSIKFTTKNLTTKDRIIIELYNEENYFSKRSLVILLKIKSELESKQKKRIEKLEEFLFKKE